MSEPMRQPLQLRQHRLVDHGLVEFDAERARTNAVARGTLLTRAEDQTAGGPVWPLGEIGP